MKPSSIDCLVHSDLAPWEHQVVSAFLTDWASRYPINIVNVGKSERSYFKRSKSKNPHWIFCRQWNRAISLLDAERASVPIFISVFGHAPRKSLATLMWPSKKSELSERIHFITHSPLNYHFFCKFLGVDEKRVSYLPLPVGKGLENQTRFERPLHSQTIGTYSEFNSESNLHYLLGVAHCLKQRMSQFRMKIIGGGPLKEHLVRMVNDLELSQYVSFSQSRDLAAIGELDLFLYVPLQNDHFIPLMAAAIAKLPIISIDIPGVKQYVIHEKTGFLLENSDILPMADAVAELISDKDKQQRFGEAACTHIKTSFSFEKLFHLFEGLMFNNEKPQLLQNAA